MSFSLFCYTICNLSNMKKILFLFLTAVSFQVNGQSKIDALTVDMIMQDPKWIGTSPSSPYWSYDSKYLFFSWNLDKRTSDSIYYITPTNLTPQKASYDMQQKNIAANAIVYNHDSSAFAYTKDGDIYFKTRTNNIIRVTHTTDPETNPTFIQ